ncbi:MAG TPA: pyrroline-5-carboxylate reductase [Spongiibacteraceae bacterium]|nr:pyrroline-5-carboxylate reductase [Spongiibacteraceae bacterium]
MTSPQLAFIGAGNMASALIGGLVKQGFSADRIVATDPLPAALDKLKGVAPVRTTSDNIEAVANADVIVLAVKPQVMKQVLQPLASIVQQRKPLIISIAAGIEIASIARWLGGDLPIVRCMPNTPALVQLGATGLYANAQVSTEQKQLADSILRAVGIALWVDSEAQLDAVTAVSGSGPAYFFLVMEAMRDAGVKLGLAREVAEQLTLQTALGAARMAIDSDVDVVELRRRVTSPNGTTERAIASFESDQLRAVFEHALNACDARSRELAKELGAG